MKWEGIIEWPDSQTGEIMGDPIWFEGNYSSPEEAAEKQTEIERKNMLDEGFFCDDLDITKVRVVGVSRHYGEY